MPAPVNLTVNSRSISVRPGTTVAAALLLAGVRRRSVSGRPRAPLCGMGTCFECRAEVDGVAHTRTCLIVCREGMRVRTDA